MTETSRSRTLRVLDWFDRRLPLTALWRTQLSEYPAPKNFNV